MKNLFKIGFLRTVLPTLAGIGSVTKCDNFFPLFGKGYEKKFCFAFRFTALFIILMTSLLIDLRIMYVHSPKR